MQNEHINKEYKKIGKIEEVEILRGEKILNFDKIETETRYYVLENPKKSEQKYIPLKGYIDDIIEEKNEAKLSKVLNIVENDIHNQLKKQDKELNSNNLQFCKIVENEEEKKISKIYQAKINGKEYYMYKDKKEKMWKFCDDRYFEDVNNPIGLSNIVSLYSKLGLIYKEDIDFVSNTKFNFAYGDFNKFDNKVHFSMFKNVVKDEQNPKDTAAKFDFTR